MLVNGIKKILCVYLITLYSVVMAAEKQIDAKKMCESVVERIGSAVGPLTHTCQGNETKASCVVTSPIQIDTTLSIKNFKCEIVSDAKSTFTQDQNGYEYFYTNRWTPDNKNAKYSKEN